MLAPEAAAGFLVNRTGDPDRQAAQDLAETLGRLPLALEQAAAYIKVVGGHSRRLPVPIPAKAGQMLARGEPARYSKTVASTWALAFDRLQHTAPGAVGLLRLLAFYAPQAIPVHLLLQSGPALAAQLERAGSGSAGAAPGRPAGEA